MGSYKQGLEKDLDAIFYKIQVTEKHCEILIKNFKEGFYSGFYYLSKLNSEEFESIVKERYNSMKKYLLITEL